jgi:hypothetical protein
MSRRAVDIAPSRVGDFDDADGGAELMEPAVVIAAGTFGVLSGFCSGTRGPATNRGPDRLAMAVVGSADPDDEQRNADDEQDGGDPSGGHQLRWRSSTGTAPARTRQLSPRRRRTSTDAATAAVAMRSPARPMKTLETTPSAMIAPSTPRIGPMQQATQAATASPMI